MQWSEINDKAAIFYLETVEGQTITCFRTLQFILKLNLNVEFFKRLIKVTAWISENECLKSSTCCLFCFLTALVQAMQTHKWLYLLPALDWFCAVMTLDIEELTFCFF